MQLHFPYADDPQWPRAVFDPTQAYRYWWTRRWDPTRPARRHAAEPAFDGVRGHYSAADTYGMLRRFWTATVLPDASPA